jgi:cbb3-type cytochrome oxidase cytochrome c subunit
MKHGPLLFLGVLSTVLASWLIGVVAPHFQIGSEEPILLEDLGVNYPVDRPGEAKQGAEVYRAQGCHYCHTRQVRQEPLIADLTVTDLGTNAVEARAVVASLRRDLAGVDGSRLPAELPRPLLAGVPYAAAEAALRRLTNAGTRVELKLANLGADIARGWGPRRTVARDYLRDRPVLLGQVRYGPDLANLGARQTNAMRLLLKLYNPRLEMPGSTMPRYPYLFEERRLRPGQAPSPEALSGLGFVPPPGVEVVPKPEAQQLVAYLLSLRADTLFYETFVPRPSAAAAPAGVATNTPAVPSAGAAASPPQP